MSEGIHDRQAVGRTPGGVKTLLALALAGAMGAAAAQPAAQTAAAATAVSGGARVDSGIVVAGVVPDESTRQAILAKAREVYGDRVVDQLGVGNHVAPPNWSQHVLKLITPELKRVRRGQLRISGNVVELTGDVESEEKGQQLASLMTTQLNPTYSVKSDLRVPAPGQEMLDASLAHRTVEFQPGNALLTPVGLRTLDDLVGVLQRFKGRKLEVIGHTDAQGAAAQNLLLSAERAQAVKAYLETRGIAGASIATSGAGAERPLAGNDTPEGRARNRRIEFRVLP